MSSASTAVTQPVVPRVWWDHDDVTGQDRQFLDFSPSAAFSVYNWELFYHIPLYVAQLLSQNQQFEDALTWFQLHLQPHAAGQRPGPAAVLDPQAAPQSDERGRYLAQQINNLLLAVNQGDPTAVAAGRAVAQRSLSTRSCSPTCGPVCRT